MKNACRYALKMTLAGEVFIQLWELWFRDSVLVQISVLISNVTWLKCIVLFTLDIFIQYR